MLRANRRRFPALVGAVAVLVSAAVCGETTSFAISARQKPAPPPPPPPPRYRVAELGADFVATDLNDRGQVVGYVRQPEAKQRRLGGLPIVRWENGRRRTVGKLVGQIGFDHRLNNRGQVTTAVETAKKWRHAAVLAAGKARDLGALPGRDYSFARDVNDAGQVVGGAGTRIGAPGERAVLWEKGKPARDLGTLGGGSGGGGTGVTEAAAINNRGEVVGMASVRGGDRSRAFLWSRGRMRDLGTLRGEHPDSRALAVNNKGQVVGVSGDLSGRPIDAFLWSGGKMRPLRPLPGDDQSYAGAINDRGEAVGYSYDRRTPRDRRAVLWRGGKVYDMTALLVPAKSGRLLVNPVAVNRRGQILVGGREGLRKWQFYLLTPAPAALARRRR